jgi:hypothetical protein
MRTCGQCEFYRGNAQLECPHQERIALDTACEKFKYTNPEKRIDYLEAENKLLREYAQHKDYCEARKLYHIPDCPDCGSKNTRWGRDGPHFENSLVCKDCPNHGWVPEEKYGECNCGLDQALRANV